MKNWKQEKFDIYKYDRLKAKCHIVKIGGALIDNATHYLRSLDAFSNLSENKILIHGGGKLGSQVLEKLNIPVKYHDGRRITDEESLKVLVMVYAGTINKKITADLQSRECNAIGLSGCDINLIQAGKRKVQDLDYGFAGDIEEINVNGIKALLEIGAVPVISPITHDKKSQLLNTNADTIASAIAAALVPVFDIELHYCFELTGVLKNVHDESSIIPEMTYLEYLKYRDEGVINKGMLPKLANAFNAIQSGVKKVTIGNPEHFTKDTAFTSLIK